ncbi:hypothetical protein C8R48DRAFT_211709 [Suillus tomentosus]|nr:hypothetical protein C8R48DRAFT_211709 [Suillus tomentosus]
MKNQVQRLPERLYLSQQVSVLNFTYPVNGIIIFNQGPGATQTGREAAVGAGALQGPGEAATGTGAAPEQKQQYPSAVSQQEEKHDERNVPERSQSGNTGQTPAQGTTEDRPQQKAEVSQKGVPQEGEPSRWVDHGKEKIHFLGISTDDEGGEQPSQQTTEKTREISHEGTQQEDGQQ